MSRSVLSRRRRALLEALESRILYSADVAAVVAALHPTDGGLATEQRQLQVTPAANAAVTTAPTLAAAQHELVFVDLALPDAQSLISGLQAQREAGRDVTVITLTAEEDGIAVISQTLADEHAQGQTVDAVHVISHGHDGAVSLGGTVLDADSLMSRALEIAGWSASLSTQADILLYGCDVAQGAAGESLVQGLAALSGADVAASEDPTGSSVLGGDWVLERQTGSIESASAVTPPMQQAWQGLLATDVSVNVTSSAKQTTANADGSGQQSVAMSDKGEWVAVWSSDAGGGGKWNVIARRFDLSGTPLSGDITVNVTTAGNQRYARVACDDAGNFVVVWTADGSSGTDVFMRRFDASGTALSGEVRVNTLTINNQDSPSIGINKTTGDFVVAWVGDTASGSQDIYYRRYTANGAAIDASGNALGLTGTVKQVSVDMNRAGQYALAWVDNDQTSSVLFGSDGVKRGGVQTVLDTVLPSNDTTPSVAMYQNGDYMVAYREAGAAGLLNPGIYYVKYSSFGNILITKTSIDSSLAITDADMPAVAVGTDNIWQVVYEKTGASGTDIFLKKYDAAGTAVTATPVVVNSYLNKNQGSPAIAVHDTDHAVVLWSGETSEDANDVSARVFTLPNTAPVLTSPSGSTASVSVNENTTEVKTLTAIDNDWPSQSLVYSITGGADASKFSINSSTGVLSFISAPDFERPLDANADNQYLVTVSVSDGVLTDQVGLTVAVADVADTAVANADTVQAKMGVAQNISVLDNDQFGQSGTPNVIDVSTPVSGTTSISGSTVTYTSNVGFVGSDSFQYSIVDSSKGVSNYWGLGSSLSDALSGQSLTPTGTPTKVAGVFGSATQFSGTGDYFVGSDVSYPVAGFSLSFWFKKSGNAGSSYDYIYSHGAAGTNNSLNVYFIESSTVVSTQNNVLRTVPFDANDSTTAAQMALLDIPATGLVDGKWHHYMLAVGSSGSAVYIDSVLSAQSSNGSDGINPTGSVHIGSDMGVSGVRYYGGALDDVMVLNYAASQSVVTAVYKENFFSTATVSVAVAPVNNYAPVIDSNPGTWLGSSVNVNENDIYVTTVHATDADVPAPTLTYSITGGLDQSKFSIDQTSGVLSFKNAPDFENPQSSFWSSNTYNVVVTASDGQKTDSQDLFVTVRNVNDTDLSFSAATAVTGTVTENAAAGSSVGITADAVAKDTGTGGPSASRPVYSLTSNPNGLFSIDANGVITATRPLDYETATSYNVTVQAASADSTKVTRSFVIQVQNLIDNGLSAVSDGDVRPDAVSEDAAIGTVVGVTAQASDLDAAGRTVTYRLLDDAGGRFAINANTGVVTVAAALDYEQNRTHTLQVEASTTDGVSKSTQSFTIAVGNVVDTGLSAVTDADAQSNAVSEDAAIGTVVGVTAQASDLDAAGRTVTYRLLDDAGGRFAINANTGVVTVAAALDYEQNRTHTVQVEASTTDGVSKSTQSFTVAVVNVVDTGLSAVTDADAQSNAVSEDAAIGTVVGVTAQASDLDAAGRAVTYRLLDDAGGRFAINANTGVVTVAAALDYEQNRTHTVQVEASTTDGVSKSTQSFTVAVVNVVDTGLSAVTDEDAQSNAVSEDAAIGTVVGVTAQASDLDAAGRTVTYRLLDDAGGRFAINANTGVVTVAGALDYEQNRAHTVQVEASTTDGVSKSTQSFTVAVINVVDTGLSAVTDADAQSNAVSEDAAIGTVVGVTAQASDLDAAGRTVTYRLLDDAGGRFAINANTGVVTVAAALDYEQNRAHTVQVEASTTDGVSKSTQSFTVAVVNVVDTGLSAVTDADAQSNAVSEDAAIGTVVGVTAQASDLDAAGRVVTYRLLDDAGGRFAINANTGVVTVAAALDYEQNHSHRIEVEAVSVDGLNRSSQTFSVAVINVVDTGLSAVTDADAQSNAVSEDATIGTVVGVTAQASDLDAAGRTVTYRLLDDAGGRFAINANTGVVTVAGALDYEQNRTHTLQVEASTTDGVSKSTQSFTVAVVNVVDTGLSAVTDADAQSNAVSEDAAIGTVVGVTAQASDLDAAGRAVTYRLLDDAGGRFAINANTGVVTVAAALDYEQNHSHRIEVEAVSVDGLNRSSQTFSVAVINVVDTGLSAVTDADAQSNAVSEDATIGTVVGVTAQASDLDAAGRTVTYRLLDDAGGRFAINANTGVVTVAGALDYEQNRTHTLQVEASTTDGVSKSTQSFTVAVVNVVDTGLSAVTDADAQSNAVSEDAAIGTVVGVTAQASDLDAAGRTVTYRLLDDAGGRFAINTNTGVVTVAAALDYEQHTQHDLWVQARSEDGRTQEQTFTVVVRAVNESAPRIDVPGSQATAEVSVDEGQTWVTQVQASDADLPAASLRYAITGGVDAAAFRLDAQTGALRFVAVPDAGSPQDANADNRYEVDIAVSDGELQTTQHVTVQVLAINDHAPELLAADGAPLASLAVSEDDDTVVVLQGQDQDQRSGTPTALQYRLVGGSDMAAFVLDEQSGALRWKGNAADYEHPLDANHDNRYEVVVEVSDGTLASRQALTVTVNNVDEAPVITRNELKLTANGEVLQLEASDPDTAAAQLLYQVVLTDGGHFAAVNAPKVPVQQFTQQQVDTAQIVFVADAGATTPRYALRLTDGTSSVMAPTPVVQNEVVVPVDLSGQMLTGGKNIPSTDSIAATDAAAAAAAAASKERLTAKISNTGNAADTPVVPMAKGNQERALGLEPDATGLIQVKSQGPEVSLTSVELVADAVGRVGPAMGSVDASMVLGPLQLLEFSSERAESPTSLPALDLMSGRTSTVLVEQLNRVRVEVQERHDVQATVLASTVMVSTGVSVGYVIWLVRGGVLMASLMSAVPSWAGMDPLPVLERVGGRRGRDSADDPLSPDADLSGSEGGQDDGDPVEKLFARARKLLVRGAEGVEQADMASSDRPA